MYGLPAELTILVLTLLTETGYILMQAGHGNPITNGDGRHSIMAGGYIAIGMAGDGYPAMNGALHGFAGEVAEVMMAGHPGAHGSLLPSPLVIITGPLTG